MNSRKFTCKILHIPLYQAEGMPLNTALKDGTVRHLATRMDRVAGCCIE